ncbi:hypothetical protein [Saliterribacillus persicus]|uniref:Uncharacterized protein n=1 Tax=Saliterribacillus persicus TaxID=930114 RepID=A0A368XA83_9BACI|nr:hypothetical protein [Saliterribacillus persicus]RCW63918.1 hypothetical protein DFR57_11543 [Saliterribacillus persicus]
MGLTSILMVIFAITIITIIVLPFLLVRKHGKGASPYKGTYIIYGLLIIHWILYVSGFYVLLPISVSDLIFIPIWFVLCTLGAIYTVLEFKNNIAFAVQLAGFTFLSSVFAILLNGISKMLG